MSTINLVDVSQMLKRRQMRNRPYKFTTMLRKYSSEKKGERMGFYGGFEKAAGKMDVGGYLRKLEDWSSKRVKNRTPNWTPSSEKSFTQVMKEEKPNIPNWKLKMQHG